MKRPIDIFAMTVEFEGTARSICLERACGEDAALRAEVESLLEAHDAAGAFLGDPTHYIDSAAPESNSAIRSRRHAPPSETPGQMIGRYKLLQPIGEGGFGSVWMAEQREPVKRRVALKIIKLGMDTKQVIARFEAERQALAMMDHPNIAKVLDAGATDSGRPYFVMELINGVPMLEYCDTRRLDTTTRLDLFIKVCNAIQHAHQKGIIHRDIKPSNVMITLHDGVPVPKVIDFGIAKATNQELTDKTLFTQHQQMIGTPAYMSPEQAEMSGLDIDTRSDIYSLGVLLYELLTGTTPFNSEELMGKGFAEMVRIIRETEPDRPSTRLHTLGDRATRTAQQRCVDVRELFSMLRGDLDWIVMKCLEKDRSRRYDTTNGLAIDIRHHLNDEPVSAGPPGTRYKLGKFIKRNRVGVIAATVVGAVLLLGVAGTTGGLVWALAQKDRAELAEQGMQRELDRVYEVKRLISDMLGSVDPSIARGQDTTLLKGILDDTVRRLDGGEVQDELIAAELHNVIGVAYRGIGLWVIAEEHIARALTTRTRLLGEDHPSTLQTTADFISVRGLQGKVSDQISLCLRNLDLRKRVLGPEDPDTLTSRAQLANAYGMFEQYDEAEQIATEVLNIRRRVLGPEHPDTLQSMDQMAVIDVIRGRTDEARALLEQLLEIRNRVTGEYHPATLRATNSLALFYEIVGDDLLALPLRLQAVKTARVVLGEQHPNIRILQLNLSELYMRLRRHSDAIPNFEVEVQDRQLADGMSRPSTWTAMRNLGTCFEEVGRPEDALALYEELLENLPIDAEDVDARPNALFTAAWILTRDIDGWRDSTRALEFARRAVDMAELNNRGANNPIFHRFLDTLALAQFQTGDAAGAAASERRALAHLPVQAARAVHVEYRARLRQYLDALGLDQDQPDG